MKFLDLVAIINIESNESCNLVYLTLWLQDYWVFNAYRVSVAMKNWGIWFTFFNVHERKKKTIKGEDNFSKSFDLLNYNDQNYPDLNISMHVVL